MGQIFSIGYGNLEFAEFIDRIKNEDIQYLIDVRTSPYSKYKPEFSQSDLKYGLRSNNISYVYMGDNLGGRPHSLDCYTEGKVDYNKTRRQNFFRDGIKRLINSQNGGYKVCLFCSESHPSQCHRCKLIGEDLSTWHIDVTHIMPDGSKLSQKEVMALVTGGQSDMFGNNLTSRKKYK